MSLSDERMAEDDDLESVASYVLCILPGVNG